MQLEWLGEAIAFFQAQQRLFHDHLATDLHLIHDTGSWLPAIGLTSIGFLYGVFHAVGPGHGKLIVTSYMLADNSSLKRGIIVVILSSLLQGLMAVGLVLSAYYLFSLARETTQHAADILELFSFGLIAIVGAGLLLRGLREARLLAKPVHHHQHCHEHSHQHDASCGHAHMPTPQDVKEARGIWPLALMIASIGIRPCSGAVILMLFACMVGAVVPGILATFAMACGTALTTALLAIAAVQSKKFMLKIMQSGDRALAITHAALGIGGGLLVLCVGLFFLIAGVTPELQRGTEPARTLPLMHLPPGRH